MWEHDATEVAYKNGYEAGYNKGIKDFAERIKKYYHHLSGKTISAVVEYVIDLIEKEMAGEVEKDE